MLRLTLPEWRTTTQRFSQGRSVRLQADVPGPAKAGRYILLKLRRHRLAEEQTDGDAGDEANEDLPGE
jgi:hypothetical protein